MVEAVRAGERAETAAEARAAEEAALLDSTHTREASRQNDV